MKYQLPTLPYSYNALEPYIDEETMKIHHLKHHQAYLNNMNKVLEKYPELKGRKIEEMLENLKNLPFDEKDRIFFKNNAGGHIHHQIFWKIMNPKNSIDKKLVADIKDEFGTVEELKKVFSEKAKTHFASGWAWLVRDKKEKLKVYSLENQDSPYLLGHKPILGLDVWEHAYYLKYQNRRAEYVDAWWNVIKVI